MFVYVCLYTICNRFFFLLCTIVTPWANYGSADFRKRVAVLHCLNAVVWY